MTAKTQTEVLRVWRSAELPEVELRRGQSVVRPVPRHWHDELQLCFVEAGDSEMQYRGSYHHTPPKSLFVVHPGEVHSNRVFEAGGCSYRTSYFGIKLLSQIVEEITGFGHIPFFRSPVILDRDIQVLYLQFCRTLEAVEPGIKRDSILRELFARLIERYSDVDPSSLSIPFGREQIAVVTARNYLVDNYARNVSLDELSKVTNLSAFHLNRVFRKEVGMPPHAFQIQLRVLRAKALLQSGASISSSATELGFSDQSHLNRHFKRLAVVTPGQYQHDSKNVQDTPQSSS